MSDPIGTVLAHGRASWRKLRRAGTNAARSWRSSRKTERSPQAKRGSLTRHLLPVGAIATTFVLIALLYLGYDLAKGRASPCEAIFQETSLGLKTKISFLKTAGELEIGREQLTDLDERAQMTALSLKTCCTVLDAGRLDPEQFLQCKGSARAYEASLSDIANLVRQAVKDGISTSSIAASAAPPAVPASLKQQIDTEVKSAQQVSRDFNQKVVAVRHEQALATLETTPPQSVPVEAQEREPNDDALSTNEIKLGTWITASIDSGKDADYFTFTSPETHRDWLRIELQNRSTTLEPRLELFDAEKASLGSSYKPTPGADLTYSFVAEPTTRYVVRASNTYGSSTGVYLMRVVATKSYDAQEPNDDILHARPIALSAPIAANIMDKYDVDYFAITAGKSGASLIASVKNRSTTLQPEIALFRADKALVGTQTNTTPGGDVSYTFKVAPNATYYLRVRDTYSSASGDYTLTVAEGPPGDG